jgi:hypothetical protein
VAAQRLPAAGAGLGANGDRGDNSERLKTWMHEFKKHACMNLKTSVHAESIHACMF